MHIVTGSSLDPHEFEAWNSLTSLSKVGRVYTSVPWGEVARISDGIATTFFRLYDGERLVGGCTGDVMPPGVPANYDIDGLLRGNDITAGASPWESTETVMPCTTVTTRAGRAADIRVAGDVDTDTQVRWVTTLLDLIRAWGAERGARSSSVLLAPHGNEIVRRAATAAGYVSGVIAENYYLDVDFDSFEEFLARFTSKRRWRRRTERRRALADPSVRFAVHTLTESMDSYVELAVANAQKYGNLGMADAARLRARAEIVADQFGADARVVEMTIDGDVVACGHFVAHDNIYYGRSIGLRPDVPAGLFAYFNVGYYELIDLALLEGVHRIVYAHQLGAAKLSHGCRAEVQDLWLEPSNTESVRRLRDIGGSLDLPSLRGAAPAEVLA